MDDKKKNLPIKVEAIIIAPTTEERNAILEFLPNKITNVIPKFTDFIHPYDIGKIKLENKEFTIVLICPIKSGLRKTQNLLTEALKIWQPRFVFIIGVCGGFYSKKVFIGDMIVPEQIITYDLVKKTDNGEKMDSEPYRPTKMLVDLVERFFESKNWGEKLSGDFFSHLKERPQNKFKCLNNGKIISGNILDADTPKKGEDILKDPIDALKHIEWKLYGIEMEVAGAAQVLENYRNIEWVDIRIVMDNADPDSRGTPYKDENKIEASRAVGKFCFEFIEWLIKNQDSEEQIYDIEIDDTTKIFCRECYNTNQNTKLYYLSGKVNTNIRIEKIFIDLDVKGKFPEKFPRIPEKLAHKFLLNEEYPDILVLGGPASGKSTLLQFTNQLYCANIIGKLSELLEDIDEVQINSQLPYRIPFLIFLKDYAEELSNRKFNYNLFHYLRDFIYNVTTRTYDDIHEFIKKNKVLILLDGLDEIPDSNLREKTFENIRNFIDIIRNQLNGDLRIIFSSRPHSYSEELNFLNLVQLEIKPFDEKKARKFLGRWIRALKLNSEEISRIQEKFEECLKNKNVNLLIKNPYQTSILLIIILKEGSPPARREELYQRYLDAVYDREKELRSFLLTTDKELILGFHKYLGFILHKRMEEQSSSALMGSEEFKEQIKKYCRYYYLVLKEDKIREEDLQELVERIFIESCERLVLIESPKAEKFGFTISVIREFLAAAYLCDIKRNENEIFNRFEGIVLKRHWMNVAFFLAGRINRKFPDKIGKIFEICKKIDDTDFDYILRRGTIIIISMIGDKIFENSIIEKEVIEYGLSLLHMKIPYWDIKWVSEAFKNFENRQIIKDWLDRQIESNKGIILSRLIEFYIHMFGFDEKILEVIRQNSELKNLMFITLKNGILNNINEKWVIEFLENSIINIGLEKVASQINLSILNVKYYIDTGISINGYLLIVLNLIKGSYLTKRWSIEEYDDLRRYLKEKVKNNQNLKKNLLLWSVVHLIYLLNKAVIIFRGFRNFKHYRILIPYIIYPEIKKLIDQEQNLIEKFIDFYSNDSNSVIKYLVNIFELMINPTDEELFQKLSKFYETLEFSFFNEEIRYLFGFFVNVEDVKNLHKDLKNLIEKYRDVGKFQEDIQELNNLIESGIINKEIDPLKFKIWLTYDCTPLMKDFSNLNSILKINKWFEEHNFSAVHYYLSPNITFKSNLETTNLIFDIIENEIKHSKSQIILSENVIFYFERLSDDSAKLKTRFKNLFEKILDIFPERVNIFHMGRFLFIALSLGVIEQTHLSQIYNGLITEYKKNKSVFYLTHPLNKIVSNIFFEIMLNFLEGDNLESSKLVSILLQDLNPLIYFPLLKLSRKIKIGHIIWNFAQDTDDIFQKEYYRTLSNIQLKWEEINDKFFNLVKTVKSEDTIEYICEFIKSTLCCDDVDKEVLFDLLVKIVEDETITDKIRHTVFTKLDTIIYDREDKTIIWDLLNLPFAI